MRILFLSHYFPPEINAPASRTYDHCREWVREGNSVTVVTCAPNHPRGNVYPGYRNRLWQTECIDGIKVVRVWTFIAANEGFGKRTVNYLSFMFAAVAAALFVPRPDVVITTSPQFFNGLAGYFVALMKRCPWVLEIRDLWPESILAVGAIKNARIIASLRWLERFAYQRAWRLVVVADAFKRYIEALGIDSNKIAVIKNGVRLDLYDRHTDASSLRSELGLEGKIVAAYFGTHGMAHHLETIFDAAELTRDDDSLIYLLVGDGARRQQLEELRDVKALGNVVMLGQQTKERMPEFWAMADISLVLLRKSELFKTVIPSKIFEAMAMATPIVLGVEGEAKDIVMQSGGGTCIEPEDATELAAVVSKLAQDEGARNSMGLAAAEFVSQHYDRSMLAQRYLAELMSVAHEH